MSNIVAKLYETSARHTADLQAFRDAVKGSFKEINERKAKIDHERDELLAEREQALYEASEAAKHDQFEAASERKIGMVIDDEREAGKPVRREIREDSSTRSFAVGNEDEETESEPYRRPERWHDQNMPDPAETSKSIAVVGKHSWHDDEEEEPVGAPSHCRDWGGSTRRIGNHEDDEDD